jgi:hypothetical protein
MAPTPTPDGIRVNTLTLAFTLIAGTVVFLRLFTRFVLTKGAGIEDACIAIAMVSLSMATVSFLLTIVAFIDWSCCCHVRASNARPGNTRRQT